MSRAAWFPSTIAEAGETGNTFIHSLAVVLFSSWASGWTAIFAG